MPKQKTIPELEAEIAAKERQIAQLQHKQQQLENRRSYYEKGDRRKRAHRLITLGAAIESVEPLAKVCPPDRCERYEIRDDAAPRSRCSCQPRYGRHVLINAINP